VSISINRRLCKRYNVAPGLATGSTILFLCLSVLISVSFVSAVFGAQTREQCERCCKGSTQDEYDMEQCRLKCFRNTEHCMEQKSRQDVREDVSRSPEATGAPPTGVKRRAPAGPPISNEPRTVAPPPPPASTAGPPPPRPGTIAQPPTGAAPSGEVQRRPPQRSGLVWPNPLNMVPGRESEAAGQILVMNGITPQHPNFAPAVQAITAILINFARNNPTGGSLPTADLERVIRQYK